MVCTLPGVDDVHDILPKFLAVLIGKPNPGFQPLCSVVTCPGDIESALEQEQGADGPFYEVFIDIVIQLGGTELHAHTEWLENVS